MTTVAHYHRDKKPTMTRRTFLRTAGILAAAALVAPPLALPGRAEGSSEGSPERMGLLTDLTLCIGCRACETACNRVNKLPPPDVPFSDASVFDRARRPTAGAFTVVNRYPNPDGGPPVYRKVQCMHCSEPACVSVCPVAAMVKTPEGPVIWDERVCIGCRYCMVACPFSIPAYEYSSAYSPRVRKCTMCYERVFKQGGMPACVEACPVKAIVFGKRQELLLEAQQRIAGNPKKYVNHIYGEHEVGGTSWLYLSPLPFETVGLPQLEKTTYGELTWNYLAAIPVLDILGPLFLIGLYHLTRRSERVGVEEALKKMAKRGKEGGP
ncbi:MAG: 4Fe-4S dicluster domain-containing protein [Chloroflexota bacterium]|nr:4Fe-4S dicluster domain-containing protein [Chloroflexota bacterium]